MAEDRKMNLVDEIIGIREKSVGHQLEYTSEEVEFKLLQPGDHLAVQHKFYFFFSYYHHGIFLGFEEGVADFGGQRASEMQVQNVDLSTFMKNSTLIRVNYPTGTCLDPKATVAHAREVISQPNLWGEYNLLRNNCEHLAIRCKTGVADVSTQVLKQIDICLKNPVKRLALNKSGWFFRKLGFS